MRSSREMQQALQLLVGEDVFVEGVLQKQLLAQYVTASEANAQAVNSVVHPAVARDFEASGMSWLESAIFFESGFYKRVDIDRVVCVTAPEEVRIQRVMQRDNISRDRARAWINRQLPQEKVAERSDYVIVNDGLQSLDSQIELILDKIKL